MLNDARCSRHERERESLRLKAEADDARLSRFLKLQADDDAVNARCELEDREEAERLQRVAEAVASSQPNEAPQEEPLRVADAVASSQPNEEPQEEPQEEPAIAFGGERTGSEGWPDKVNIAAAKCPGFNGPKATQALEEQRRVQEDKAGYRGNSWWGARV